MKEKVLETKKNGLAALLLVIALYMLASVGCAVGARRSVPLMVISIVVLSTAWILLLGLKVLRPQEALVLTLFGRYIGTLKGEGFTL